MKTKLLSIFALFTSVLFAQQADTITFENLNISAASYWDGAGGAADTLVVFDNLLEFHNNYESGYWLGGFAYSTITDTTDKASYYSAITAKGYNNSNTYAIGQGGAEITHKNIFDEGDEITGFYITNSTYAFETIKKGNMFAKKFGGVSGNDADWFKISIHGKSQNGYSDTVHFYLADYRFVNNNSDYIVSDWQFVDLSTIGMVDTLFFNLSSSDVGMFGMNTPSFFCMDNVQFDHYVGVDELNNDFVFSVYPNPANSIVNIDFQDKQVNTISIYDASARIVYSQNVSTSKVNVDVSNLASGIYYLQSSGSDFTSTSKLIKN